MHPDSIGSVDPSQDLESGSRKTRTSLRPNNELRIFLYFEEPLGGPGVSSGAWTSFIVAVEKINTLF